MAHGPIPARRASEGNARGPSLARFEVAPSTRIADSRGTEPGFVRRISRSWLSKLGSFAHFVFVGRPSLGSFANFVFAGRRAWVRSRILRWSAGEVGFVRRISRS